MAAVVAAPIRRCCSPSEALPALEWRDALAEAARLRLTRDALAEPTRIRADAATAIHLHRRRHFTAILPEGVEAYLAVKGACDDEAAAQRSEQRVVVVALGERARGVGQLAVAEGHAQRLGEE